jgi:hypothetical protein
VESCWNLDAAWRGLLPGLPAGKTLQMLLLFAPGKEEREAGFPGRDSEMTRHIPSIASDNVRNLFYFFIFLSSQILNRPLHPRVSISVASI